MRFWSWLTTSDGPHRQPASPWADPHALAEATFAHLLSGDPDTASVSREVAMNVPALARARNMLCGTAARLPLVAQRQTGPLDNQPSLVQQIDPGRTNSVTLAWIVDELLFNGCAWLVVVKRDAPSDGGRPSGLRVVPASRIDWNTDGTPRGVDGRDVPVGDWVRIDGLNEGVLSFGRVAIRQAADLADAAGKAARNPVPSVELHQTTPTPTLTPEEIGKLKADWLAARAGRSGGVAYTPASIEARMHGQAAEQLLIDARQQSAVDMARIMGVPGWAVDAQQAGASLTYGNVETRVQELLDFGLYSILAAIEDRFSMDDLLPRGVWARFDTARILAGNLQTRADAYQAAQDAGILTQDDARAIERGLTPKEG